jgi:hypothetical protein
MRITLLWIVVVGLSGGTLAQFSYERHQHTLLSVDVRRLEMRIDSLEHKPVIFNAAIKVGDEVVLFNKSFRGKVLAVAGGRVWASFNGQLPATLATDEVALVKDVKD